MKTSKKHKWGKPYHRKIHIGGEVWTYRIAGFVIIIRTPDGTHTFKTDIFEINETTEREWDAYVGYDPDRWTYPYPSVGPRLIKEFIEKHCMAR